jgi:hypothetical protein
VAVNEYFAFIFLTKEGRGDKKTIRPATPAGHFQIIVDSITLII